MFSLLFSLLIAELIVFYFLAQRLNQTLFLFFYLVTKSERIAFFILTLLFFPGTVVHELAHLFTAEILGVKTGKLSLIPKRINHKEVEAGSVQVAKADPFRMTVIGLAPIVWGIVAIAILSLILQSITSSSCFQFNTVSMIIKMFQSDCRLPTAGALLIFYLLFSISTNMFSSREDVKGVLPVLIVIGIIGASLYIAGVRVQLTGIVAETTNRLLLAITRYLGIALALNTVIFLLFNIGILLLRPSRR